MINSWLEIPYEEEPTVYCPRCNELSEIKNTGQIYCYTCDELFDIPEPDIDEEVAYGY